MGTLTIMRLLMLLMVLINTLHAAATNPPARTASTKTSPRSSTTIHTRTSPRSSTTVPTRTSPRFLTTIPTRSSTTFKTSSSPRPTTSSPQYTSYYFMDDSLNQCGSVNTNYLERRSSVAYVKAWGPFSKKRPGNMPCELTFTAYASEGIKYSFSPSYRSYFTDCSVTLYVYSGTSSYSPLVDSYSCYSSLPTYNNYVHSRYLTFRLVNYGGSKNFDFQIKVTSYDHSDDSAGLIAGLTIGCFAFGVFIFVVACVSVRARRRRLYRQRNALIPTGSVVVAGVAPTAYGSNYQQHPPPPPPAGSYQPYPAPPPYQQPPPPAGAVNQPPLTPAGAVSQPPPHMSGASHPAYGSSEKPTAPAYGAA